MYLNSSFSIFIKKRVPASATVEGAIVIPIFVYACISIIFMIYVQSIKTKVSNALYNTIRKYERYAYTCEELKGLSSGEKDDLTNSIEKSENRSIGSLISKGISDATFREMFIEEIGRGYAEDNFIVGDNAGWNFLSSRIMKKGSRMDISLSYMIKNPFNIFGFPNIVIIENKVADAWLGEEKDTFEDESNVTDKVEKVYVTAGGEAYHKTRKCTYITRIIKQNSLDNMATIRNNSGGKYYPCEKCGKDSSVVFYTMYGNRIHSDINCKELTRTVLEIDIKDVGNRRACSKCFVE